MTDLIGGGGVVVVRKDRLTAYMFFDLPHAQFLDPLP